MLHFLTERAGQSDTRKRASSLTREHVLVDLGRAGVISSLPLGPVRPETVHAPLPLPPALRPHDYRISQVILERDHCHHYDGVVRKAVCLAVEPVVTLVERAQRSIRPDVHREGLSASVTLDRTLDCTPPEWGVVLRGFRRADAVVIDAVEGYAVVLQYRNGLRSVP